MRHLEDKLKNDAERFKKQIESEKLLAQYKKIQFELHGESQSKSNGTEINWELIPIVKFLDSLLHEAEKLKWDYDEAETDEDKNRNIKWFANHVYDLINGNKRCVKRLKKLEQSFRFSAEEIESYQKENKKIED